MRELGDYCLIGKTLTPIRLAYMATLLPLKAGNGYEGVVKLLLTRKEADPEIPDEKGGTLLSRAAEMEQEGSV